MKRVLAFAIFELLFVSLCTEVICQTTMDQFIGINSRMEDPNNRVGFAGTVREYHPWVFQEGFPALNATNETASPGYPNPLYKYNPSYQNQTYLNTDDYYQDLQNRGVDPVPTFLRSIPQISDPSAIPQDPHHAEFLDVLPISNGANPLDPASYIAHAHFMYNYVARYGNNSFSTAKTNATITPYLHANETATTGMGYLNYVENWNEQDKWWLPQYPQTYFEPEEYAAMLSADYDGHMSSMQLLMDPDNPGQVISGVGIKNADPNIKMVMGGLSDLDTTYLKDMVAWFDANRTTTTTHGQYPLDVINFHHYSDTDPVLNSFGPNGQSPEEENLRGRLEDMVALRDAILPGKELWLSEFGYDIHPTSVLGVETIGSQSREEVQGQWITRAYMEIAAAGFDRAMLFEIRDDCTDTGCNTFATSGLLKDRSYDYQPKISWYYVSTMSNVLENTVFDSDVSPTNCVDVDCNNECPRIYRFTDPNSTEEVFAIWSPTTCNKTYNYTFDIGAGNTGQLITMEAPSTNGTVTNLVGDMVTVPVSERPVFIAVNRNLSTIPPVCPADLETASLSCDLVTVKWDSTLTNQKISVWHKKFLNQPFNINNATLVADNIPSENAQYTVSGLDFSSDYSFYVFAEDANGNMTGPCYVAGSTTNMTCKIDLTTSMVYESTGQGSEFYGLIDEHALSPNCGTQSNALSPWGDFTGSTENYVSFDFGEPYLLNAITFFDDVAVGTVSFQYATASTGPWITITDYLTTGFQEWRSLTDLLPPTQAVQYFRVSMQTYSNAKIGEIILCGETLSGSGGGGVISGANCDSNCPCKICLDESWITDLTPDDDLDPTKLVDEQDFIDPICTNTGNPTIEWGQDWDGSNNVPPYQAILDLQQCYLVESIYLFDGNGSGLFDVEYEDQSGNWILLESYTTSAWNSWHEITVDETIQNIRFTKHDNGASINEVSICGLPIDCGATCVAGDADGDGICADAECDDNDPTATYDVGDSCDDGDPNTINDVYNASCICAGSTNNGNAPCATPTNVALGGTAIQSGSQQGGTADKLIDGNTEGDFYVGNSINITSWVPNAYWEVDLGAIYKIEEINIWGRTDCCTGFTSNYHIFISETPFNSTNPSILLNQSGVTEYFEINAAARPSFISTDLNGRYVRIQLAGTAFLSLSEVEIIGCDPGNIGTCPVAGTSCDDFDSCTINDTEDGNCNCAGTFEDADNDNVCDVNDVCPGFDDTVDLNGNGIPDGCDSGTGGACTTTSNLALAGTATQSGTQNGGVASKAIDGNTNGNFWSGQSVTNTNWVPQAWWEIDLGGLKNIEEIKVYNRTDCCNQYLTDYHVFVSDVPFASTNVNNTINQAGVSDFLQQGIAGSPDLIPLSRTGRYVRIQIDGTSFINIAEVEIEGCDLIDPGNCNPAGTTCNDNDPCTINDVEDGACNCAGTFEDTDNDTVCDNDDICPNGDDTVDANFNGIPDDCDTPTTNLCDTPTNLALNGTATQSGVQAGGSPNKAIDGNTNGNFWGSQSVINTSWVNEAYWEIDLGTIYNIDYLNIYNRTDCCASYLSDYHVFVSDVPFTATDVATTSAQTGVTDFFQSGTAGTPSVVTTNMTGRYVRIQIDVTSFINIAEVEIFGCPTAPVYCVSNGVSTAYEYVDRVVLQEIDNISGNNGGFLNARNLTATVEQGTYHDIQLTPGFTGTTSNVYWSIYADLNQDDDFTDSGELLFQDFGTSTINDSIFIPNTALTGITTMRVSMKAGSYTGPCDVFAYGEVEDYSLNISSMMPFTAPLETQTKALIDVTLYPNPVEDILIAQLTGNSIDENDKIYYSIFNAQGVKISDNSRSTISEDHRFFVETQFLENGYYFLSIEINGKNIGKSFIKLK